MGNSDEGILEEARAAYVGGYYMEAEAAYERYLKLRPQGEHRYEAWTRLFELAVNVRDNQKRGVEVLEAALLEFGDDPEQAIPLLTTLADLYERQGKREQAVEIWQKSLEKNHLPPEKVSEIMRRMAKAYRVQGYFDLAQDVYIDCAHAAQDPASKAMCLYELGLTYSLVDNFAKAREVLEEVRRMVGAPMETHALATFLLAEIAETERKTDEARKLLESIRDSYPNPKAVETRLRKLDES